MNIAVEHVAPEEIMAVLDGEFAGEQAQAVSQHVEECVECSKIAEQLRDTSQSLSTWIVPSVPQSLNKSLGAIAAKSASLNRIPKPGLSVRMSFWTWKRWTLSGAGALAALVIVAGITLPNLHRSGRRAVFAQRELNENVDSMNGSLQDVLTARQVPPRPMPPVIVRNGPPALTKSVRAISEAELRDSFAAGGDRDKLGSVGKLIKDQESKVSTADGASAPMIARSVSLSIMVKDFPRVRAALDAMLARHHGYAAQLNVNTPENAGRSISASLRVPAPELDAAIADCMSLGRVQYEAQSGEDVTKQHTDLLARLKTSRDTEQRFRAILEQRPGNVAEVLQVEEGIARVRGDIERMEAEQKALEHRVDFASVDLELTEEYEAALNPPAPSVATRIHNALVAGYENAQETLLGILLFFVADGPTILIWLAILAIPVLLVWRRFRKMAAAV